MRACRLPGVSCQPGGGPARSIGKADILAPEPHLSAPTGTHPIEHCHRGLAFPRAPPRHGPHHRQRRLKRLTAAECLQAIEPGSGLERLVSLQRLKRRHHRGPPAGGGVKPAAGDSHHARPVSPGDRLLQFPFGTGAKLQLIGLAALGRKRRQQAVGIGLNTAPGAVALIGPKEEVAVAPENFIEQRGSIAPSAVGDEPAHPVELPLFQAVSRERHSPRLIRLFDLSLGGGCLGLGGWQLPPRQPESSAGKPPRQQAEEDSGTKSPRTMEKPCHFDPHNVLFRTAATAHQEGPSNGCRERRK